MFGYVQKLQIHTHMPGEPVSKVTFHPLTPIVVINRPLSASSI